ncbi:hypothetical protein [Kocuria palustris]|uniref:hypothetical protein n=1 Tax=Kocuria palustris TaxID=71999 RepID=UPI003D70B4F9
MKLAPRHLAVTAALALALTACGSDDDSADPTTPAEETSQAASPPEAAPSTESGRPAEFGQSSGPAEETAESTTSPAPHSAPMEEGVVPANPGPADIPGFTEEPAAGQAPAQQGQADQPASGGQQADQPASGGHPGQTGATGQDQSAQNPAGLSDEAFAHFQAGGACYSDFFPAGIPSASALQEIKDYCAATDPADWDVTDGVPNPFGVPDPVM